MNSDVVSFAIDRASPVPLYFQVAERLEFLIESRELPPGSRLDNEIDLADRLGVSRPTMRRAIQYLVDRGLLVRRRGVGTSVLDAKVRRPVELTSLYDHLAGTGRRPRTTVLSFVVEEASDAVAHELGIPDGARIYNIERLRYAGDQPLAILRDRLPVSLVDLSRNDLEAQGLYEILREHGIAPRIASQMIGARTATAAEARMLDEASGSPLLTMKRMAYDELGRVVDQGDHIYRASLYTFELTLTST